jgi:predicted acylesterase/phospholipase RssA
MHFFGFDINEYKAEDISYLTHPKLSLITAIQITCALPIIFTPVCMDGKCYIDGGTTCNYPLNYCIDSGKTCDEILGFKNKYSESKNNINIDSNLIQFLSCFLYKAIFSLSTHSSQKEIKNEVTCDVSHLDYDFMKEAINSIEVRKSLFENGVECGKIFFSKLTNENNESLELENSVQELN